MSEERHLKYLKFRAAFLATWNGVARASGKTPNVVIVGSDARAKIVQACLRDLALDANVIADDELTSSLIITDTENLALMPGNLRHEKHGHTLGGGKN